MTKIKEACLRTGLSEKAIRLYMKEGLIHPQTEEGVYRNSYSFSEKDIQQLTDIAILRNAGFGISDIREMQQHPESLPSIIEEKQTLLAAEIHEKQILQNALRRLSETERGTTKNLADGLRPALSHKTEVVPTTSKRLKYIVTAILLFTLLMGFLYIRYGGYMIITICAFLSFLLGAISIFMAFRYLTTHQRALSMPQKGTGYIASVIQNGGFDIAFARAGGATTGTKEPGAGGIWLFLMAFWNEIRPDNWYPVIQYPALDTGGENADVKRTDLDHADTDILAATFPYGGFKTTWQEGEVIEIAWTADKPTLVFPLGGVWLKTKSTFYSILGIVMWLCSLVFIYLLVKM